jgi:hypothetical protein
MARRRLPRARSDRSAPACITPAGCEPTRTSPAGATTARARRRLRPSKRVHSPFRGASGLARLGGGRSELGSTNHEKHRHRRVAAPSSRIHSGGVARHGPSDWRPVPHRRGRTKRASRRRDRKRAPYAADVLRRPVPTRPQRRAPSDSPTRISPPLPTTRTAHTPPPSPQRHSRRCCRSRPDPEAGRELKQRSRRGMKAGAWRRAKSSLLVARSRAAAVAGTSSWCLCRTDHVPPRGSAVLTSAMREIHSRS